MSNMKRTLNLIVILILATAAMAVAEPRVAVVLGHYPDGADSPHPQQTPRVHKAAQLFFDGKVDTIVVTGGYTREHISEARMMRIGLVALGVPDDAIVEEQRAATTVENAYFTEKIFTERGWKKRALIVSQNIHLQRAIPIFQDQKFEVKKATSPDFPNAKYTYPEAPESAPELGFEPELILMYEPYEGDEPVEAPGPGMVRRVQAAAAAYRNKTAPRVVVYSEWCTRGPMDPAEVMKIALATLGVDTERITAETHIHYGNINWLIEKYKDTPALLVTPAEVLANLDLPAAWHLWAID